MPLETIAEGFHLSLKLVSLTLRPAPQALAVSSPLLPEGVTRVLVTVGAGFIGGAVVRRLLRDCAAQVFNLDKLGYASDCTGIDQVLAGLGTQAFNPDGDSRHQLLQVDLADGQATAAAVAAADPDLVMHLAAESHVDRSIDGPGAFIDSNVTGTFNLLQAVRAHWEQLPAQRRERFRFHHISTDEVFGSLGPTGRFSETTPYDPRSPYSASKAASDHLVSAWHHTYGLPVVLTNCSNNYGPWQFPEKLIPVVILKALAAEPIPLYGDGANVRDWLYVDDHVEALLLAATRGRLGESYCVGGAGDLRPVGSARARWRIPCAADHAGGGSSRSRPALCHRRWPHQQRAGLEAPPQLRSGAGGHGALVSGAPALVPAGA